MFNAIKPSAKQAGQAPDSNNSKLPTSVPQQQPGYSAQDTVTRSPAPAVMTPTAAPQQQATFERNGLKAPSCPGLCWPQDEDCIYFNKKGARVCCIKIG